MTKKLNELQKTYDDILKLSKTSPNEAFEQFKTALTLKDENEESYNTFDYASNMVARMAEKNQELSFKCIEYLDKNNMDANPRDITCALCKLNSIDEDKRFEIYKGMKYHYYHFIPLYVDGNNVSLISRMYELFLENSTFVPDGNLIEKILKYDSKTAARLCDLTLNQPSLKELNKEFINKANKEDQKLLASDLKYKNKHIQLQTKCLVIEQKQDDIRTLINSDDFDIHKLHALMKSDLYCCYNVLKNNPETLAKVQNILEDPRTITTQEKIVKLFDYIKDEGEEKERFSKIINFDKYLKQANKNLPKLSGQDVYNVFKGIGQEKAEQNANLMSWVFDEYYNTMQKATPISDGEDIFGSKYTKSEYWENLPKIFDKIESLDVESNLGKFYQQRAGDIASLRVLSPINAKRLNQYYYTSGHSTIAYVNHIKELIAKDINNPHIKNYCSQIPNLALNSMDNDKKDALFDLYDTVIKTYKDTKPEIVDDMAKGLANAGFNYTKDIQKLYDMNPHPSILERVKNEIGYRRCYGDNIFDDYNLSYELQNKDLLNICTDYLKGLEEFELYGDKVYNKIDYTAYHQAVKESNLKEIEVKRFMKSDETPGKEFLESFISNNPNLFKIKFEYDYKLPDNFADLLATNPKLEEIDASTLNISSDEIFKHQNLTSLRAKSVDVALPVEAITNSKLKEISLASLGKGTEDIFRLKDIEYVYVYSNCSCDLNKVYKILMANKPKNLDKISMSCKGENFTTEQKRDLMLKYRNLTIGLNNNEYKDEDLKKLSDTNEKIQKASKSETPLDDAIEKNVLFEYLEYLNSPERMSMQEFDKDGVFKKFNEKYPTDEDKVKLAKYVDFGGEYDKELALLNAIQENKLPEYLESIPKDDRPTFADLFKNNKFIKTDSTPMNLVYESSNDNIRLTKSLVKTIELLDADSSQLKQIEVSPDNDKSYALKNATKMILDKRNLALARQKQVEFSQQLRAKQGKE